MQRTSRKRDAVFQAVKMSHSHPTAQDIWDQLRPEIPDLSLGTVYRNLSEFAEAGLIRRLDGQDGQSRFDGDLSPHAHFMCSLCGAFLDVPMDVSADLIGRVEKELHVAVSNHDLSFSGLCQNCMKV